MSGKPRNNTLLGPAFSTAGGPADNTRETIRQIQENMTTKFSPQTFGAKPDEDARVWLAQFERFAAYKDLKDAAKVALFPMLFVGTPAKWFGNIDTAKQTVYKDAVDAFTARFIDPVDPYEEVPRYFSITQSDERVGDYVAQMVKEGERLKLKNAQIIQATIHGMHKSVRPAVVQLLRSAETEDIETLKGAALIVEQSHPVTTKSLDNPTLSAIQTLQGQVAALTVSHQEVAAMQTAPNFGPPSGGQPRGEWRPKQKRFQKNFGPPLGGQPRGEWRPQ